MNSVQSNRTLNPLQAGFKNAVRLRLHKIS